MCTIHLFLVSVDTDGSHRLLVDFFVLLMGSVAVGVVATAGGGCWRSAVAG